MRRVSNLFYSLFVLIMISGCGGGSGGGGGDDGDKTLTSKIKGYVADGPIDGSIVTLYDESGKKPELCRAGICEAKPLTDILSLNFQIMLNCLHCLQRVIT